MKPVLLLVSAPKGPAGRRLARALVEERLAACVTAVPGAASVYRWKGRVERTAEELLFIKSARPRLPALFRRIKALHPYDVPEILVWPVAGGNADYLAWLGAAVAASGRARIR
ncbi:MAG TPA: divalent-cation tolerance protein CutA [Elusimicrobiota bacterium]|nr:divalent-cation tolerance protein CutA [Elusimicrobiota bacterium]HMU95427.1 divalent-cation tolerance protein CutA [Elusimicrobiota bacterium]HMX43774.1 divalent-cation tolerance protein CutA [Elusimicrobiota bacterium]HMZ27509.1 divalent-cation tolerance protein CutA [Elusimicrobiota bacterium]HNC73548.1 divalent-cation tolerance protein CutA [Elusimicrobiota bacterium]